MTRSAYHPYTQIMYLYTHNLPARYITIAHLLSFMSVRVYDVNMILRDIGNDWCHTFIYDTSMDVGVLRLKPGDTDPQSPHANDEIYYIIRGDGFLNIEGKDIPIREGMVIFVPAKKKHRFHGNKNELIALYVFAGRDEDV